MLSTINGSYGWNRELEAATNAISERCRREESLREVSTTRLSENTPDLTKKADLHMQLLDD